MSNENIEGLDDFVYGDAAPIVVAGMQPQKGPAPAFRLYPQPPRTRVITRMVPEYEDSEMHERNGEVTTIKKLVGFKPTPFEERVEGGYLLVCFKGKTSVFIENLDRLKDFKLSQYVKMVDPNDPDDMRPSTVHLSQVIDKRTRAAA